MARPGLGRFAAVAALMTVSLLAEQMVRSAHAAGAIQVSGAYALADVKSPKLGYVYLTISASKGDEDALIGGSSPRAASVALVDPSHRGALQKIGTASYLPIDGHVPLVLQPRGPHLVLHGLSLPLHPGQKFYVTLMFRQAADVDVLVDVLSKTPAAGAPRLPKGVKID